MTPRLLMSAREFRRVLGIGSDTLAELERLGEVTPVPWLGGRVRYSLEEAQRIAREGVRTGAKLRPSRRRTAPALPGRDVGDRILAARDRVLARRVP